MKRMRILIIEDDLSILNGLKDVLTFKDYEVFTATDGEAGYAAAKEKNLDLIILDIMLPKWMDLHSAKSCGTRGI